MLWKIPFCCFTVIKCHEITINIIHLNARLSVTIKANMPVLYTYIWCCNEQIYARILYFSARIFIVLNTFCISNGSATADWFFSRISYA